MTTMQLDEIRVMDTPEIVANAIIEADSAGVELDDVLQHIRTEAGVASYLLDKMRLANYDRLDYWHSNFIIVGII